MKKRTVALMMACVMVFGVAVGGTMAWLTDESDTVTNTFTVGDINITLTEDVDTDKDGTHDFHYVPGDTLTKNPVITVVSESEAHYLFVKAEVTNNSCTSNGITVVPIIDWKVADGWTYFNASTKKEEAAPESYTNGTYYFYRMVEGKTAKAGASYSVLSNNQVTVSNDVTKDMYGALGEKGTAKPQLKFTAAAIQSDNIESLSEAWDELPDDF